MPEKLYKLHIVFHDFLKPNVLAFINEKLSKPPDEERSIKQLLLHNMQLFEYDPKDEKKRQAEKTLAREKHWVSPVRKKIEERGSGAPTFRVEPMGNDCVGCTYWRVESTSKFQLHRLSGRRA